MQFCLLCAVLTLIFSGTLRRWLFWRLVGLVGWKPKPDDPVVTVEGFPCSDNPNEFELRWKGPGPCSLVIEAHRETGRERKWKADGRLVEEVSVDVATREIESLKASGSMRLPFDLRRDESRRYVIYSSWKTSKTLVGSYTVRGPRHLGGAEGLYFAMLICPVRDCRLELVREDRRLICPRAHSFDVAKSGYINLLQPQERKSKNPGDSAEAVAARRRLHDRGVTAPLLRGIAEMLGASASDTVLDAGCGDGFYLGTLAREAGFRGCGIDISMPAIEAAARRYPDCEWIVGNADRFVPYRNEAFSAVMSITARMNAQEFSRVLTKDGRLLVALPAASDLIELRGVGRDRVERTVETFVEGFALVDRRTVTTTAELDEDGVRDILLSIYRPMRTEPVTAMSVTFSLDLLLFRRDLLTLL